MAEISIRKQRSDRIRLYFRTPHPIGYITIITYYNNNEAHAVKPLVEDASNPSR